MRDHSFTSRRTARLRLRRFAPRDAEAFHAYRADDDVARFQSWRDYSLEQAEAFVEEMSTTDPGIPGVPFQFAVALIDDDRLVGDCMLAIDAGDPPTAEIGYTIAHEHQGRGYSVEAAGVVLAYAFDRQGVAAVRAVTDTRNAPSIAVAERLGMTLVATVHTVFKGEPCDEHTYEVARDEWRTRSG